MDSRNLPQDPSLDSQTNFKFLKEVGDYTIIRLLGIGGMGEVFLAEQKSLKRLVALKILLPALTNNRRCLERFFQEVRTLAKIEHPGIVRAFEAGAEGDICYFSMMFVEGEDLRQTITRKEKLDELNALEISVNVASSLDYAWRKYKLIHRDIKPANIILARDGSAKILDLGISKIVNENQEEDLTMRGIMVGSPHYISPEQAKAEKVDFHTDMYALGATLFHMLAGEPPYDADSAMAIVSKHISEPVPDVRKINPAVSEDTVLLISRLMAKNARERFPDWSSAIKEIKRIQENLQGTTGQKPKSKFIFSSNMRRKLRLIAALAIALAGLACLMRYSINESKHRQQTVAWAAALNFGKNAKPEQYDQAIARLENIIKNAPQAYATSARNILDRIYGNIAMEKRSKEALNVDDELKNLRLRSYELEKQEKFKDAVKLWIFYETNSPFRGNKKFSQEVARTIAYLKDELKKQEIRQLE
ncbi:MAG: serine/threonine-protein kinase [Victivallaceae bacterium]